MMTDTKYLKLYGRIFIRGSIELITGLAIGTEKPGLEIGGIDRYIIRNAYDNRPYIPGSSLKGRMRSLAEKSLGAPLRKLGDNTDIYLHTARTIDEYQKYWVNPIFGVPATTDFEPSGPTRLTVRDIKLSEESARKLEDSATPYAEVKPENVIGRISSQASPRFFERVPAGAKFDGMELKYDIYEKNDLELFWHLIECMKLVEDDALGGLSSRGYGRFAFSITQIYARTTENYEKLYKYHSDGTSTNFSVDDIILQKDTVIKWLKDTIVIGDTNT